LSSTSALSESLEEGLLVLGGLPEIGSQVFIGLSKGLVSGLQEVASSSGLSSGRSVAIVDTSKLNDLLGGGGSDDTRTSGTGDESDSDGTALSGDLNGDGMGVTDVVTPIASSDGDHVKLGIDDGTLDGTLDFLSALNTKTDVAIRVTDQDESFHSGSLTGSGLLLDGHDLHDFFLQFTLKKSVDDLMLLDGEGVFVDFLEGSDLVTLDESAELGDGVPLLRHGASLGTLALLSETSAALLILVVLSVSHFMCICIFY